MKKVMYSIVAIALVLTFTFFAVASGGSDAQTSGDGGNKKNETTTENAKIPAYKLGETVTVKTSDKEYTITITGVKETKKRNEFSDKQADRVILISYEFENIACEDDLYISDMDMKVYDKDNNILENYPATERKSASSVSQGRKGSGVIAYALNNANNYVEMEHYSNIFNSRPDCKFLLEW